MEVEIVLIVVTVILSDINSKTGIYDNSIKLVDNKHTFNPYFKITVNVYATPDN